jgi:hypothetical protein
LKLPKKRDRSKIIAVAAAAYSAVEVQSQKANNLKVNNAPSQMVNVPVINVNQNKKKEK